MDIVEQHRRKIGMAVVFSGPSGVGKDTVLNRFLETEPGVARLVTATTRPMRDSETDGVDYHFVTEHEFARLRDSGELLEWATVHDYHYGSTHKDLAQLRGLGIDVILKLDVQGGLSVRAAIPDSVLVFVAPPSLDELIRRLEGRKTETPERLAARLANAEGELNMLGQYDYLVINDTVDQACEDLRAIVRAERKRVVTNE